ncbi:MAG: hypothetical protein D6719_02050, partial [Candidatus Dadabacteria bacterium]
KSVYANIKEAEVSVNAIKDLVEKTVPAAGFMRGCLYLRKKEGLTLVPLLRFGDVALERYKTLHYSGSDPVSDSLFSSVPIKWRGNGITGEMATIVAGGFDDGERTGVLYLELDPAFEERSDYDAITHFNAIKKAVVDCLSGT